MTQDEYIAQLEDKLNDLSGKIDALSETVHIQNKVMEGIITIKNGQLRLGGGIIGPAAAGQGAIPLRVYDSPNIGISGRFLGFAAVSGGRDTAAELISTAMGVVSEASLVKDADGRNLESEAQVSFQHAPNDPLLQSFFFGFRSPIVANGLIRGMITQGGNTLTDMSQNWGTDMLAGAVVYIQSADLVYQEAFNIISNTKNTLTIQGTWASPSNQYPYLVETPVFLGGANYPWKRVYTKDDIRFGIGPSNGTTVCWIKQGVGSPEGVVTAQGGSLYMDRSGNRLYVKQSSGFTSTGWVIK